MATTTYRSITELEVGQAAKEATVNAALENLSRGISGIASITVTGSNVTLTDSDQDDQAKNLILLLTGLSTGARNIIVPTSGRAYVVVNNTTGGFTHTVKTAAGTGVAVAPSMQVFVVCDGTNVILIGSTGTYTDEMAQDAIGAMVDSSLVYVDGTPLLTRAALTGDVTASQGSNALAIANDAVTYAKMQNVSATSRALGRKTAGAGDVEEITLSELLDFIGSAAHGDILYRGASAWARLAAGTSGYLLQTQGAGANPQWVTSGGMGSTQGRHTIWVPAAAMFPAVTSGPSANQVEMATNKNNHKTLSFPDGTKLYAHFDIAFPKAWNLGTVTYQVYWTLNSTSTNAAVWGLQGMAASDNDGLDGSYGTAVQVSDAGLGTSAYKLHVSAESSAVTIGGTPADADNINFRFYRDPTDGSDTLAVTAELIGVKLFFTTNADTDA